MGLAKDSNINSASGTRIIWLDTPLGHLPFTRGGDIAPKSGYGLSLWGGGEYDHPLSGRLRLRSGVDISAREHRNSAFDRHFVSFYSGPRWLIDPFTEFSLLATGQRQWEAGKPETDEIGFKAEGQRHLTPQFTLFGRASLRRRNCRGCDWYDGPVGDLSVDVLWFAMPTLRLGAGAGYRWSNARVETWRTAGPNANVNATVSLPAGFTVGLRASAYRTRYDGSGARHFTLDRKQRTDRLRILQGSVYNRAFTVFGFSPRVTFIHEERKTNAQTLDFDRNRAEISFVRQF